MYFLTSVVISVVMSFVISFFIVRGFGSSFFVYSLVICVLRSFFICISYALLSSFHHVFFLYVFHSRSAFICFASASYFFTSSLLLSFALFR